MKTIALRQIRKGLLPLVFAIFGLVISAASSAHAINYNFSAIDFPGATHTEAHGINDSGNIVGYYTDAQGINHGFLYAGGAFTTIDVPGAKSTYPNGINNSGNIVGSYIEANNNGGHGFLRDASGIFTTIDVPGSIPGSTQAFGINDSGDIVGTYFGATYYGDTTGSHGFLYAGGSFRDAPPVLQGSIAYGAYGINNSRASCAINPFYGDIVGFNDYAAGKNYGVFYFCNSGNANGALAIIYSPGASYTEASGINDSYDIVGTYGDATGVEHGFLYVLARLTTIDVPGSIGTALYGINNSGDIVGVYADANHNSHGLLATPSIINISVTPTTTSFGNVNVGQATNQTITITNQASSNATLTGSVGSLTAPFSVQSGSGAFNLPPGQSVTVTVRFSPTTGGAASANLSITHNATNQNSPTNVALSGTGVVSGTNISINPTSVNFGSVTVGQSSNQNITITNQANSIGPLTGSVGTLTAPFAVVSDGGAFNLTPGQSMTVTVQFSPTIAGPASASLSITHNATNQTNPTSISLNGTGVSSTTYAFTAINDYPGSTENYGYGINDSSTIGGYYQEAIGNNEYRTHGFLYAGGNFTTIDYPGASETTVYGINNFGNIVGFYWDTIGPHGFLRDPSGNFTTINFPGASQTSANGINDSGTIVGWHDNHGYLRDSSGNFTTIDVPGAVATALFGINNSGKIVGIYNTSGPPGVGCHGFLRDAAGNVTTIDGPNATDTYANGINDSDKIVGYYVDATGINHGFLYEGGNFTTIDFPGLPANGLTQIYGISNNIGQIVGIYAVNAGSPPHIFVATPPGIISVPTTPSGPASGRTGISYSYSTGGSASIFGNPVEYQFDWKGDGTDLSPYGSATQSKRWTGGGTYKVRSRARDTVNTTAISDWSPGLSVSISAETVSTPTIPSGPSSGVIIASYTYTTGGSTSSFGNPVEYQFDWKGDGSDLSNWGSGTQSKAWTTAGVYNVRARARSTPNTSVMSGWSNPLTVSISVPRISITPTAYDFGNVKVKRSKIAAFRVTNTGTINLLMSASINGTDGSMSTTMGGGSVKTIKPRGTMTIKVAFKPTSKGSKSATLEITSNDPITTKLDIPLSGTGQ